MQQNPFFRARTANGQGVDINLNFVSRFVAEGAGTRLTFNDGQFLDIDLSPAAVRGRTRKAWPVADASSDAD